MGDRERPWSMREFLSRAMATMLWRGRRGGGPKKEKGLRRPPLDRGQDD